MRSWGTVGIHFFTPKKKKHMYKSYKSATVGSRFFFLINTNTIMLKFRLIKAKNCYTRQSISKLSRSCSWKVAGGQNFLELLVPEVLKYRKSAVRGYIMCRKGIIFTQLKMNVCASWSVVNLIPVIQGKTLPWSKNKKILRKKSPSLCTLPLQLL